MERIEASGGSQSRGNGPIWNKKKEMGKRKEGKREESEAAMEGREARDTLGEGDESALRQLACVLSS